MLQYRLIIVVLVVYTTLVDIGVSGDYQCLCSHSAVSAVYGTKQYTLVLGYMYSKDCKPTYPDHSATFAFYAVQFENKVGYIINTPGDISFKNCTGLIPTTDAVTMVTLTSAPPTSTTTVSIATPTKTTTHTPNPTAPTTKLTTPTTKPTTPTTKPTTPTTKPTTTTTKPTTRLKTHSHQLTTKPTTIEYSCPHNWIRREDSCYYFMLNENLELSQPRASDHCRREGAHLVFIESPEEQQWITTQLQHHHDYDILQTNSRSLVWTGGVFYDHQWKWVDHHTNPSLSYTHWSTHVHPDRTQDCIAISGAAGYYWLKFECVHASFYICERSSITQFGSMTTKSSTTTTRATKPTTTRSHSTSVSCPRHWTRYKNSCYFVELVHDLTQHGAESKCMQSHGHLAYIESSTEQHFLESYISSQSGYDAHEEIWIGGERHNHNWYWNSDHRMTYTKWDPNNIDRDQDCLTFRGRGNFIWKPSNCDHNHMYVCELQLENVQLIG